MDTNFARRRSGSSLEIILYNTTLLITRYCKEMWFFWSEFYIGVDCTSFNTNSPLTHTSELTTTFNSQTFVTSIV